MLLDTPSHVSRAAYPPSFTFSPDYPARLRKTSVWQSIWGVDSTALAIFVVALISMGFVFYSSQFYHWFAVPVSICGVLMLRDVIEWSRSRNLFDPAGLIALWGFHCFFTAPLLHVALNYWLPDVAPPPDWRVWLGYMGLLNVAGLGCYELCRRAAFNRKSTGVSTWTINKNLFHIVAPIGILISTAAQVWVYHEFGGISGYMDARLHDPKMFEGMGKIFMISESAPILVAFLALVYFRGKNVKWWKIATAIAMLFAMQLVFGGLRGSRSEMVFVLFWVVGCVHMMIRPVPWKFIAAGCAFLAVFMYVYGFYKNMGSNFTQAFSDSASQSEMGRRTGRTWQMLVLGDLGRADLQAFILYRLIDDPKDFTYAKGRTYLGSVALLIPGFPTKPETVAQEGTDIQFGSGSYLHGVWWSSRVYGLAGEAMLNFGALSVPLIYGAFGLLMGWFRSFVKDLKPTDARILLIPFAIYMLVSAWGADSDNLIFGLAKNGLVPFMAVWISSIKISAARKAVPLTARA